LTHTEVRLFFELVRGMRQAQKLYFKTRGRDDLVAAKQIENEVDKFLAENNIRQIKGEDGEPTTYQGTSPLK